MNSRILTLTLLFLASFLALNAGPAISKNADLEVKTYHDYGFALNSLHKAYKKNGIAAVFLLDGPEGDYGRLYIRENLTLKESDGKLSVGITDVISSMNLAPNKPLNEAYKSWEFGIHKAHLRKLTLHLTSAKDKVVAYRKYTPKLN